MKDRKGYGMRMRLFLVVSV